MRTTLSVCLLAVTLALAQDQQHLTPVAGSWDGDLEGAKAVTVSLRGPEQRPEGKIVFYILKDEASGLHSGSASPELPMEELRRDGDSLRFRVRGSDGRPVYFEMRITGGGHARLTRRPNGVEPELTIVLRRQTGK